jgi:hypothetical protein
MDLIQAQRELSDKDLVIFNAELQRRAKSTGIALSCAVGVCNPTELVE